MDSRVTLRVGRIRCGRGGHAAAGLPRRGVRLLLAASTLVAASLAALGVGGATVHAASGCVAGDLDCLDPAVYDASQAIVQHIQVPVAPTEVDPTGTQNDYIWVDYIRPNTPPGVTVPTIMDASPYYNTLGRGYLSMLKSPFDPNAFQPPDVECGGCPNRPFPEWEAGFFIPRGYAVALMDLRGTRNSTGCEIYGDKQEAVDAVNVVDWIADQPWSNGRVGMIGGSYDGTIANGAAALYPRLGRHHDPDALAAVVPIRAIDRWYDYQFFNGVEANGQELDPELFTAALPADDYPNSSGPGGDPNFQQDRAARQACPGTEQVQTDAGYAAPYQNADASFWRDRDYLQYASTWRAATFFVHGLYDFNVKTMNSGQLWQSLPASVPKRLWYFNGAHADPDTPTTRAEESSYLMPFTFESMFETEVHRWFLQFLKGVDAGALDQPTVQVQRDDGHWDSYGQYPFDPTYADDSVLHLTPGGHAQAAPGPAGSVQWNDSAAGTNGPAASQSFLSDPLTSDTLLSGQFEFDLDIAAQGPDTTIAVEIDDVPPNPASGLAKENVSTNTRAFAFNYAYIRPWYRDSIHPRGASTPTGGAPLTPDQQYAIRFPSTYMDYVVHAGHRLRFTFSNSSPYSIAADTGKVVTMYTGLADGTSQVRVPQTPYTPAAQVPELGPGAAGLGGPVTGMAIVLGALGAVRVRQRFRRGSRASL